MATRFKTLNEYLYPDTGKKTFVIPNYQRGYKWSVRMTDEQTSVEYLIEALKSAYRSQSERQFFLQGVTVVEDGNRIILIDGQQRTTTLYLLLWCLGRENITGEMNIDLDYDIRKQPKEFLKNLKEKDFDPNSMDKENKSQDIFYFKQAITQINALLADISDKDKKDFTNFLRTKISMLYVVTDRDKAVRTFTMMNGQKARMHDEELVKADMLHIVSQHAENMEFQPLKTLEDTFAVLREVVANEWETNALRSKYAREWDKWLYWWNKEEVKEFFNTHKPMGLLLEYYYKKIKQESEFSFRKFKALLPEGNAKESKKTFKGLRDLQKDFEDIYNDPHSFNYLKCAMIGASGNTDDKYNIIAFYIKNKRDPKAQEHYAKWRLAGATHIEITEESPNSDKTEEKSADYANKRTEKAHYMIDCLSKPQVYNVFNDMLYKQLLRLNVEEYNKLNNGMGAKFDFSVWKNKSLEHIYPKSHFYHIIPTEHGLSFIRGDGKEIDEEQTKGLHDSEKWFSDKDKYSEHCIGNLVLLYGMNNSEFGMLPFDEKKKRFFNNERSFESRNLLHTISAFANSTWEAKDIEEAADRMIERLKRDYNIYQDEQDC